MQTLFALLLTVAAAYAIARPPGYSLAAVSQADPPRIIPIRPPPRRFFRDLILPVIFGYHDAPTHVSYPMPPVYSSGYLNQEIDRIKRMKDNMIMSYRPDMRWMPQDPYPKRIFAPFGLFEPQAQSVFETQPLPSRALTMTQPLTSQNINEEQDIQRNEPLTTKETVTQPNENSSENPKKTDFALTPTDKGYFDKPLKTEKNSSHKVISEGGALPFIEIEPPRKTRQNPLSRSKTLIAENMEKLKIGLGHEDSSERPHHIHVLETAPPDPAGSIYGVALIAAIGAAVSMAVVGFAFGWYTLSKRAKAAADVDYPAYGVTGPTIDTSGDRKLAHSAHMYHYHHQKQQIIAMERNGMDQHNGSVSDPESEEENEEGHYTVYECPGFATTGDMEVKNPLFNEDPTPATPGKCEIVKPQPKE